MTLDHDGVIHYGLFITMTMEFILRDKFDSFANDLIANHDVTPIWFNE